MRLREINVNQKVSRRRMCAMERFEAQRAELYGEYQTPFGHGHDCTQQVDSSTRHVGVDMNMRGRT